MYVHMYVCMYVCVSSRKPVHAHARCTVATPSLNTLFMHPDVLLQSSVFDGKQVIRDDARRCDGHTPIPMFAESACASCRFRRTAPLCDRKGDVQAETEESNCTAKVEEVEEEAEEERERENESRSPTGNEGPGNKKKEKKKHGGHRWRRRRRKVAKKVLAIKGGARREAWQAKSGKRLQWQPESLDEQWLSREQQRMESKEKAKEKRVACSLLPRMKGSVAMASKEETLNTLGEKPKKLEEFSRKLEKRKELEETQSRLKQNRRLANKMKEGRRDAEAKMKENAKSSRSEDEGNNAMARASRGILEEV